MRFVLFVNVAPMKSHELRKFHEIFVYSIGATFTNKTNLVTSGTPLFTIFEIAKIQSNLGLDRSIYFPSRIGPLCTFFSSLSNIKIAWKAKKMMPFSIRELLKGMYVKRHIRSLIKSIYTKSHTRPYKVDWHPSK